MATQWAGLVTNASPFLLPENAAVEQVNLSSRVPGVLRCRGGMVAVQVEGGSGMSGGVADVAAVEVDGEQALVCLLPSGAVRCVTVPAGGAATAAPASPSLTAPNNGVATHYTFAYDDRRS